MRDTLLAAAVLASVFVPTSVADNAGSLDVLTSLVRHDDARNLASFKVDLRCALPPFDLEASFRPDTDPMLFQAGDAAQAVIAPRAKGLRIKTKRGAFVVSYRRPRRVVGGIKSLKADLRAGTVRVVADRLLLGEYGDSSGGLPVTLSFGAAQFAGVAGGDGSGALPTETSLPYLSLRENAKTTVTSESTVVVEDAGTWASLWNSWRADNSPPPAVDFTTKRVCAMFMGYRPVLNYSLTVRAVVRRGDTVVVRYQETRPYETCYVVHEPVALAAYIAVDRSPELPIVFEKQVRLDCGYGQFGE